MDVATVARMSEATSGVPSPQSLSRMSLRSCGLRDTPAGAEHVVVRPAAARRLQPLTLYQKFIRCILILTGLIAIVIVSRLNLALKILISIFTTGFDPTDYAVFRRCSA